MRRILFHFALLFVSFFCICGMCSKRSSGGEAPKLKLSKGFLCTFGKLDNGTTDTLILRYGPAEPVTQFTYHWVGSFFKDEKDAWEIFNPGNNTWRFQFADGHYLGFRKFEYNNGFTEWRLTLDKDPDEYNRFVINSADDDRFVIESVANRGYFLNTVPVGGTPYQQRHGFVRFVEGSKQYWFLLP
jgi:hypothetical protein